MVAAIKSEFPDEGGVKIAQIALGCDLSRSQDWFNENILDLLRSIGGDPMDYKQLLNGDEAIEDALRDINVDLIPTRSRDAIFVKMQDYLNGSLDKASLLEAMMKSTKIGGWGWDQDIALPVVEKLETHLREAEGKHAAFVSKEKFAEVAARKAEVRKQLETAFAEASSSVIPEVQQNYRGSMETVMGPRVKPEDDVSKQETVATAVITKEEPVMQTQTINIPEIPSLPDPFDFLIQENLPHLSDAELNISKTHADPFADLLEELAGNAGSGMTFEIPRLPEPEFEFANITEHRGLAEKEAPKTVFERALHASDVLLERELLEIEHHREELMKDVPETAIVVSTTLEALLERIMNDCGFHSADASLEKRVRNIVSSRLRDIRGSEETAKLLAKISQGQRDLSRDLVEKIVMYTEQAFLEFQRKVIERTLQRERAYRVRAREEVLEQKREEIFANEKDLNERFKKLTGKDMPMTLPRGEEVNKSRNQEIKTAPERRVNVTLSSKSVAPSYKNNTEPVADVKYQRQLSGPTEELKNMRLTDFRRLSKDPKEAIKKLLAKLELLNADGYEKKVAGVMAWRESPIMKLYMTVTKASLDEAIPLTAVLEEKRRTIPEMLTFEECSAIRELNSKLRY